MASMKPQDIPIGYKRTEVGVIPEDWNIKSLEEMTDLKRPICYGIVQTGKHVVNGVMCVRVIDLENGMVNIENLIRTSKEISSSYKRTILVKGDIIVALRGKYGEPAIIDDSLVGANLTRGVALVALTSDYNNKFLCQYLYSTLCKQIFEKNLNGSALQEIPIATLRRIPAIVPPLPEQRAIAEALSDVDALISSLDKLIAKKRDIKQAAMQQLLTGKKRLPGFSGEWEMKTLGDMATFYSGGTPSTSVTSYYGGDIAWITSADLNMRFIYEVEGSITKLGFENCSAKMVSKNTLLLALYGATAGVVAITRIDAAINQAVLAISMKVDCSTFMFFKFEHLKEWIINTYTQGGQPNLTSGIIKSIEITIPTLPEQTAIATVLSDMDAEISALEQKRDKTRQIKQGMMQELLTGRIRLV